MVKAKPWARVETQLDGDAFAFPAPGRLVLNVADASTLRQLDDKWSLAPERDLVFAWYKIGAQAADRFVVRLDGQVVASWAGKPGIQLLNGRAYRLDALEVAPAARGDRVGTAVMHLVALRAHEAACALIVLGAAPSAVRFYDTLGATSCSAATWKAPPGMVAKLIPADVCATLASVADTLRD